MAEDLGKRMALAPNCRAEVSDGLLLDGCRYDAVCLSRHHALPQQSEQHVQAQGRPWQPNSHALPCLLHGVGRRWQGGGRLEAVAARQSGRDELEGLLF